MKKNLYNYIKSIRPLASVFSGLTVLAGFRISTGKITIDALYLMLSVMVIYFATVAQNDLRDRWHDAKKGKTFVLHHEKSYKHFTLILWILSILVTIFAYSLNIGYGFLLSAMILIGLIYSEIRLVPILPNLIVAITCGLPTLFPLFVSQKSLVSCWIFCIAIVTTMFAREILKDFDDQEIDPGYKWTLLQWVGQERSLFIIFCLMYTSSFLFLGINYLALPILVLWMPLRPSLKILGDVIDGEQPPENIAGIKTFMDFGLTILVVVLIFSIGIQRDPIWANKAFVYLLYGMFAYLLGSFPFSWIATWLKSDQGEKIDLRKVGSGNVGATNAARKLGFKWFIALVILDASKAAVPVLFGRFYLHNDLVGIVLGLVAVFGHCFPIYLRFQRGKGISSSLGMLAAGGLFIPLATFLLSWIIIYGISKKRVSIASIVATLSVPLTYYLYYGNLEVTWILSAVAILVLYRHTENIENILDNTEPSTNLMSLSRGNI